MTTQPSPQDSAPDTGAEPQPSPAHSDPDSPEWKSVGAPHSERPPLPRAVKVGGFALLGLILIAAILIGVALGGGFGGPSDGASSEPTRSPALTMDLPVQVGEYVRGEITTSQGPAPDNKRIARADYSDGENSVVLLLTFPEPDLGDFLEAAGIETGTDPSGSPSSDPSSTVNLPRDVRCGTSVDTSQVACARVVDETGLLLATVTPQDTQRVEELLEEFQAAVTP